ncbi:cytochrome P450 [Mycobacterium cookii]|uniref:Cytochrome P450 n=1 Tax=Mycobacterium cookii TaxID=1775 RepID=A0A7I7L3T3_9MYCO|nr:cytochrome P450 [Mycobacterium cookii]
MGAHAVDNALGGVEPEKLTTLDSLPRPPIHSLFGWGVFWTMPEVARRHMAKLGERVVVDIPFMPTMVFTTSVQDARAIFLERGGALEFNDALRRLSPHERVLGKDLIDAFGGGQHDQVRRLVMPAFKGRALRGYERAMVEATRMRLETWELDKPVSFYRLMKDLARDVIMSVVFGVTEPERRAALEDALIELDTAIGSAGMMGRYFASMVMKGKWLPFKALDAAIAKVDEVVAREVEFRRATPAEDKGEDCLSMFLMFQQQDGEDGFFDDQILKAFMRMLLLAGYETTATTLGWVAERLVRHPKVMEKLDETLAVGDETYLEAVIAEAMRVRPALPITIRAVEKDCRINDLALPAGTIIVVYVNAIQKAAHAHADPERFDPERFAERRPDPMHWMPFGGGAHFCLGAQLSLMESRVLLRTILERRRFAPDNSPDERQVQHRSLMTLPGKGARVTLLKRD